MPTFLYARSAVDAVEEQKIRKLAGARHAPADWIRRAKIITLSWAGLHTTAIAAELHCHPKTVREWLHRFNAMGLDGLGDRPVPGRPRRLTEHERGRIIALVSMSLRGRRAGVKIGLGCPPTPALLWAVSPRVSLAPGP
jgi:Homeodomain-like domain